MAGSWRSSKGGPAARPLSSWLAPRIALAGLAPLAVVAVLILGVLLPQLRAELEARHQALARAVVGQIEAHLLGAERELGAIAEELRNQGDQPASFWFGPLDAHAGTGDVFAAIYFTDAADSVHAVGLPRAARSHRGDLLGLDLSMWPSLRQARERNAATWSETFLSAVTGRLAVTLAIPASEKMLVGEIALDRLAEFIGRSPGESGTVTMILDRRGQIVAHSRTNLSGQQLSLGHLPIVADALGGRFTTRNVEMDGETFVGTPVRVPQLEWVVLVAEPRLEAFRPLVSTLWVLAAGALVALLLTIVVAFVLARGVAGRIGRYADQAHAIAGGNYEQPWPVSRIREFDGLAGDLQRMSSAIRRRENDLMTSQARYRSLIGNAPVVMFQLDENGIFTLSEGKGLAGVGLAPGEAVGRSVFELYRDNPEVCEHARRTLRGEAVHFTTWLGEVLYDVHASPVRDADGKLQVMGVTVDITERKRAEEALRESEARLRAAIESVPFDLFLVGLDGRYLLQNSVSRRNWGDVIGKRPEQIAVAPATLARWNENNRRARAGEIIKDEFSIEVAGKERYIYNIIAPVKDGSDVKGIVGLNIDITDRKHAEEKLRLANLVVENSPVMLFRWRAEEGWPVAFVSHNVGQLGYAPDEMLHESFRFASIVHADDRERVGREVAAHCERGAGQFQQEYRIHAKDGSVRWVDDRTVVERDADGRISHLQGIVIDITERKRDEETLKTSETDLQLALDVARLGHWKWDIRRGEIVWSERCKALYGLSPGQDVTYELFLSLVHPEDRERVDAALRDALDRRGAYELEKRIFWPDGSLRWTSSVGRVICDPDGQPMVMAGVTLDITDRKRAEEGLRAQEQKFRALIEHSADAIALLDAAGTVLYGSAATERILGYEPAEVAGRPVLDFVHPDWWGVLQDRLGEALGNPNVQTSTRVRAVHKDGSHRYVEGTLTNLLDNAAVRAVVVNYRDITERRKAERALQRSEERMMLALRAARAGAWEWNVVDDRMIWSEDNYRVLGLQPGGVKASYENWLSAVHPDDRAPAMRTLERAMADADELNFELRVVWPDGSVHWVNEIGTIRRDASGRLIGMYGIQMDISERKAAEEALRTLNATLERRVSEELARNREKDHLLIQQSRLAAMGEMIGNIAHQWRQPINALALLLGNIHDAQKFGELTDAYLAAQVERGQQMIQRMSSTIDDFRNFFRPNREAQPFNVGSAVKGALSIVESAFVNHGIEIEVSLSDDPALIGFPNEYTQVLLNLLSNAREAIEARGRRPGKVAIGVAATADEARLTVRDNGGGIAPEVVPKIFDPYFTTRESGTGIGLYMSKMIVENNMRGRIEVRNTGDGAEFTIVTPIARTGRPEPSMDTTTDV